MRGWLSDREGLVHVKGDMYVAVQVIQERQSWGRTHLRVRPLDGAGDTWIDEGTLINATRTVSIQPDESEVTV